jgi:hypothetical protein
MVRGSQYHGSGESKYHGYVGQYAMGRGDQNPMGKWVNIPWAVGQNTMVRRENTMGKWVFIPWIGGRYAMGRGPVYHG